MMRCFKFSGLLLVGLWLASSSLSAQSIEAIKQFRPKPRPALTVPPSSGPIKGLSKRRNSTFELSDNRRIDSLLDTLHHYNAKIRSVKGFRLQVFTGIDREQAMKTKETLYRVMPNEEVYVQFVQPTFKVKVGDYRNRYDAHQAALNLRPLFPNAVIINDEVRAR